MAVEVDDVSGLLAAKHAAAALQSLQDVAVAHVRRDHPDAALLHQPVEAEVRHRRHDHRVEPEVERENREDLVAVERVAVSVDGEHPVAVPVEGDTEVELLLAHELLQRAKVGGAAADVDVRAVRVDSDRSHLRAEVLEGPWRDPREGAVRAVDADAQTGQVGAKPVEDVVEIAVDRDLQIVDLASLRVARRSVEQRLDLFLVRVGELAACFVKELDAVVLGRVVRGRDHGAKVESEERDRRRRKHPGEDGVAAGRRDAAREGTLELAAGGARVPADEDRTTPAPERCRPTEPLDQLRSQVLADDPAYPICAEVPACHEPGQLTRWPKTREALKAELSALAELRCLAGLVQAGLLALDDPRVAGEEAFPLQDGAQLWVGLDERAGDPVADGVGLTARPA